MRSLNRRSAQRKRKTKMAAKKTAARKRRKHQHGLKGATLLRIAEGCRGRAAVEGIPDATKLALIAVAEVHEEVGVHDRGLR